MGMGAIDNFLKRWGFARLDRYGLVLTPEGRVLSTRPAVLDDGFGGRIVGWLDGDLAAMELEHVPAPKPAAANQVAAINRVQPAPIAARVIAPAALIAAPLAPRPLPGVAPIVAPVAQAVAPVAQAAPVARPAAQPVPQHVAPAPVVAAEPEPEEDWEWEIAVARARAAAEEVEAARVDLLGASAVIASAVIQRKTKSGMAAVTPIRPTSELAENWDDTREQPAPQPKVMAAKSVADVPRRSTIIPVPTLPVAADPRSVRPAPYTPSQPRARMARGTGSPRFADTVQTNAAPPSNDQTSPYIMLPPEVKPIGYAHTKRVAAKQR